VIRPVLVTDLESGVASISTAGAASLSSSAVTVTTALPKPSQGALVPLSVTLSNCGAVVPLATLAGRPPPGRRPGPRRALSQPAAVTVGCHCA